MINNEEKRKFKRVQGTFEVIADFSADKPLQFTCQSCDVSEGGMRIELPKTPKVGSNVRLTFELPNYPKALQPWGVVVWASPAPGGDQTFHAGVKFTAIKDAEKQAINSYVSKQA